MVKKVTDLTTLTTADANDVLLGVDVSANTSKQIPVSGLATAVAANLPTGSVQAAALSSSAIMIGYAQITSAFNTSSTTAVQVTGLSVTVTIPAGNTRRVRISAISQSALLASSTGGWVTCSIWDGTVGSGTLLAQGITQFITGSVTEGQVNAFAVVTPSAGSHTYNVGLASSGSSSTMRLNASANSPAFISVEYV